MQVIQKVIPASKRNSTKGGCGCICGAGCYNSGSGCGVGCNMAK